MSFLGINPLHHSISSISQCLVHSGQINFSWTWMNINKNSQFLLSSIGLAQKAGCLARLKDGCHLKPESSPSLIPFYSCWLQNQANSKWFWSFPWINGNALARKTSKPFFFSPFIYQVAAVYICPTCGVRGRTPWRMGTEVTRMTLYGKILNKRQGIIN